MANPFGRDQRENQDKREQRKNPHGRDASNPPSRYNPPHGREAPPARPHDGDAGAVNRVDETESEAYDDESPEAYAGSVRSRILNPRAFAPVIAQARRRVPGTINDEDWKFAPEGSHMSRWALDPLPGNVADLHVRFKTKEGGETRTFIYHYYDIETAAYVDNLLTQAHHPHGMVLFPLVILAGVPFS